MKLIALFGLIVLVVVSAAPTKEELEAKAKQLETRIDEEVAKVKATRPLEVLELERLKTELRVVAAELQRATLPAVVAALETRLNRIEEGVERELSRLEGRTGTPGTRPTRPTGRPTRPQTTAAPVTEATSA